MTIVDWRDGPNVMHTIACNKHTGPATNGLLELMGGYEFDNDRTCSCLPNAKEMARILDSTHEQIESWSKPD